MPLPNIGAGPSSKPRIVKPKALTPSPDAQTGASSKPAAKFKRTAQYKRDLGAAQKAGQQYQKAKLVQALRQSSKTLKGAKVQKSGGGGGLLATIGGLPSAVVSDVGKELKGTGAVEGVIRGAGDTLANAVVDPKAPGFARGLEKLTGNAVRDIVDLPANVVPAVYKIGSEAVTGHPVKAAKDLAAPYIEVAKHPGKSLTEHPVGTLLLASGVKGGVGRGAGKVLRSAPSEALRRVGSTERAAATVPGTTLEQSRPYSKDVITKARQVVQERVQAKGGAPAPRVMSSSQIQRRVDEHVAASEDLRRLHRGQVVQEAQRAITRVPGKNGKLRRVKPTAATVLGTQNIARPGPDLAAYLKEVEQEGQSLTGSRKAANRETQVQLRKAISSGDEAGAIAAAQQYAKLSGRLQGKLAEHGIIPKEQSLRARQIAAEARPGPGTVEEPAFVTHAPGQRGARNFYVPTHEPPRVAGAKRTGAAVTQGTLDVHPAVLTEQAARSQGLIDAADRYGAFVKEFGVRGKSGKVKALPSYQRAQQIARELAVDREGNAIPGAVPMRPVRLNPFLGKQEQLNALLEHANTGAHPVADALHEALSGEESKAGPWALVPEAAAKRMQEHVRTLSPGAAGRVANLYGGLFRRNVLAFSPKWLTGNIVEAATRSLIGRAGPRSYVTGRAALARLQKIDPAAAEEARARTIAGGHYSLGKRATVTTRAEHFAGTRLAKVATGLGKFTRTPGPKQLVGLYHAYTDFVFNSLNGRIESQFQTAMLGKALRDSPLMSQHVVKLSAKALDEAARGLRNTNTMAELGREVDRMYGRYGKMGPTERRFVAAYTPFLAWTRNAAQFLGSVLPRDHPVLTSLLVASDEATQEWRKQHGLVFDPFGSPNQLPDFLQGSIPGKGGSHLRASRYVPFGVVGGGVEGLADLVMPQWRDVQNAFHGQDWLGRSIGGFGKDATQAQRVAAAATALIESAVPGLSVSQAAQGGSLRKKLDPFAFTQQKQPKVKRKGGSGWGGTTQKKSGWGPSASTKSGWG